MTRSLLRRIGSLLRGLYAVYPIAIAAHCGAACGAAIGTRSARPAPRAPASRRRLRAADRRAPEAGPCRHGAGSTSGRARAHEKPPAGPVPGPGPRPGGIAEARLLGRPGLESESRVARGAGGAVFGSDTWVGSLPGFLPRAGPREAALRRAGARRKRRGRGANEDFPTELPRTSSNLLEIPRNCSKLLGFNGPWAARRREGPDPGPAGASPAHPALGLGPSG